MLRNANLRLASTEYAKSRRKSLIMHLWESGKIGSFDGQVLERLCKERIVDLRTRGARFVVPSCFRGPLKDFAKGFTVHRELILY